MAEDQSQFKLKMEGHCDERGTVEYNLALGERRAKAAVKYLNALGISADRMTTVSYGEEQSGGSGSQRSGLVQEPKGRVQAVQVIHPDRLKAAFSATRRGDRPACGSGFPSITILSHA